MFKKGTGPGRIKAFVFICNPYAPWIKLSISYFMCLCMTIGNAKWAGDFPFPQDILANAVKWKPEEYLALVFPSEVNFRDLKCVLMAGFVMCAAH